MAYSKEDVHAAREHIYDLLRRKNDDGLCDADVVRLAGYTKLLDAHISNSNTPVEDFIVNLADDWGRGMELTPDLVIDFYINGDQGFREWFEDAVQITKYFSQRYPRAIGKNPEEAQA